jgi:hypothetical protein
MHLSGKLVCLVPSDSSILVYTDGRPLDGYIWLGYVKYIFHSFVIVEIYT